MRDERLRRGLLLLSALSGGLVFVSFVLWAMVVVPCIGYPGR